MSNGSVRLAHQLDKLASNCETVLAEPEMEKRRSPLV